MKILGWMQCRSRIRNVEPATGLVKYSRQDNGTRSLRNPSRIDQKDYLSPKVEVGKAENGHYFESSHGECNSDEATHEVFPGFLSIGTLNMESISYTEPATPMFGCDEAENVSLQMEEPSYDLKLINEELHKFVKDEKKKEDFNESRRTSVANDSRRTSVASTITLSGKEMSDTEEKDSTFPLQSYLLASSYDLSVSEEKPVKERASLLELFRRTGVDKNSFTKAEMMEEDQGIEKHITLMNPMKKIIQTFQPCVKKSDRDGEGYSTASKNFHKIRKLFQRKVHPEEHVFAEEINKLRKWNKAKTEPSNTSSNNNKDISEGFLLSENGSCKSSTKNKSNTIIDEYWIRTDEDYVIMELGQK